MDAIGAFWSLIPTTVINNVNNLESGSVAESDNMNVGAAVTVTGTSRGVSDVWNTLPLESEPC